MYKTKLKTRVYIDGYNLYYGCLKDTPYKWLDLVKLFEKQILPSIKIPSFDESPELQLQEPACKFFTAEIVERAAKSKDSVSSQAHYHSALRKLHGSRLEIIKGYYAVNKAKARLVDRDEPKKWPRDCAEAAYWKLEEKQSDVNLALNLYHDVLTEQIDHAVVVTNDTDIAPAMKLVRENSNAVIGLVIPSRDSNRQPNAALAEHAHWMRKSINTQDLELSQLPRVVKGGKRPSSKPISWYERPDLLEAALEVAIPVLGDKGKAFKWLSQPSEWLENKSPLEFLDTNEGAERVMTYMQQYIESQGVSSPSELKG